jgi:modification methylase
MLEINKIHCGDCLELMKQLEDNSVDLIVTSPPYNKQAKQQNNFKSVSWSAGRIKYDVYDDNIPQKEYEEWQKLVLRECIRVLKPKGSIFYNHKQKILQHKAFFPHKWLDEFNIRQMIVWNRKGSPILEPIRFLPTTEYIFWITKQRDTPFFNSKAFSLSEVWTIVPKSNNDHPAPFPEELVRNCIFACGGKSKLLLDPFAGSGTALVVAKQNGMNYIGFELSPEYCKMANKRLSQQTLTIEDDKSKEVLNG